MEAGVGREAIDQENREERERKRRSGWRGWRGDRGDIYIRRENQEGTGMMEHSRHTRERKTRVSEDKTTKRSDDDEGDGRSDGNIPTGPSVDLRGRDERLLQNDEGEERKPG